MIHFATLRIATLNKADKPELEFSGSFRANIGFIEAIFPSMEVVREVNLLTGEAVGLPLCMIVSSGNRVLVSMDDLDRALTKMVENHTGKPSLKLVE